MQHLQASDEDEKDIVELKLEHLAKLKNCRFSSILCGLPAFRFFFKKRGKELEPATLARAMSAVRFFFGFVNARICSRIGPCTI